MRKPRQTRDNARYHVSARANRKEMIFDREYSKILMMQTILRAKRKFAFSLENFCIMGNHYHLIIKPGKHENLSRILQWIMSVFAMAYNRHFNLSGHVWGERFFSRILQSLKEYLRIFEYIDDNPVKAGLVRSKAMWPFGRFAYKMSLARFLIDPLPRRIARLTASKLGVRP